MWNQAISEALLCPICKQLLKTPVSLKCGHTCCRSCINYKLYYMNVSTCPVCNFHLASDLKVEQNATGFNTLLRANVLIQNLVNCCRKSYDTELNMSSNRNTTIDATTTNNATIGSNNHKQTPPTTESMISAKLRRRWCRAYRRRGKLHLEESIAAFCLAAICESQPNRSFRQIVGKVLNNLLSTKRSFRTQCSSLESYPRIENRHRIISPDSDSEETCSGDEDFTQNVISVSELRKIVEKIVREFDSVRKPHARVTTPRLISPSELDCVLCSRCFLEPVTTSCGHTFCRECLERVLDYGVSCPLCVAPISRADLLRGSTTVIERLMRIVIPTEYNERIRCRQSEIDSIDSQVPIFVCTTAFPGIACPLFVYEPRYRLLTRRCLQSPVRRFGMAAPTTNPNEKFSKYGTLLEIKDAVRMQDGCSILTTIGVKRFQVMDTAEKDGYDVASVQYIQDVQVSQSQLPALQKLHDQIYEKAVCWVNSLNSNIQSEIVQSFGTMPAPEFNWYCLPNGPTWVWWLMAILPLGLQLQVGILGTTNVEKRLRAIDKTLEHVIARMSIATAINKSTNNSMLNCNTEQQSTTAMEIPDSCNVAHESQTNHLQNRTPQQQPINL